MKIHILAVAGTLIATPLTVLAAAPATAAATVHVPFADLDLASPGGADRMDARLRSAARSVCLDAGGRELAQRQACADETFRDARDQLRLAQKDAGAAEATR